MPKHEHHNRYDQEFLTKKYEEMAARESKVVSNLPSPEIDDPLIQDSLQERKEIVGALAQIREDFFHYGRGYDSLMDGMVQSPLAVLDCIRHVLEGVGQYQIDYWLRRADPFSDHHPPTDDEV